MLAACNGSGEEGNATGGDEEVTLDFWFLQEKMIQIQKIQ